MGGDTVSSPASSADDDHDHFSELTSSGFSETDDGSFEFEANERRKKRVYDQVFKSYDELKGRVSNIDVVKSKILSYTPGSWVENVGGMTVSNYNVPKTTTLLLIGPIGSGKSSLVNRISRVFEDDKFAPERAQVTYNSSTTDGTCFLREYMIPRNSTSFCLYDTRSFSNDLSENLEMIRKWMTKGVRHGKLVNSATDNPNTQAIMKHISRRDKLLSYKRRTVNFVIFVVNGLSVLKCLKSNGSDTQYTQMVADTFSSLFLSFKDHKPAIAITHGDLLSLPERARVRVHLGELLGVHPCKQTFDIPDNCEPTTELTIVDMVRYALEHADRNLPPKTRSKISKGSNIQLWTYLLLLLAVGMFIFTAYRQGLRSLNVRPENVPETSPEMKKATEVQPESVLDPSPDINKVMERPDHRAGFHEPNPEIKEVHPERVPETSPKIKEAIEVQPKSDSEPSLETKSVQAERVPEPGQKKKRGHAKKVHERGLKVIKARARRISEAALEVDWKKIRHLWYDE